MCKVTVSQGYLGHYSLFMAMGMNEFLCKFS